MSRKRYSQSSGEPQYWASFADLMSGFALTLVLLMLFSWAHAMVKVHTIDTTLDMAKETANVRSKIIAALPAAPSQETGSFPYEITPNGTIIIREQVLFDTNEAAIKPEGKPILAYWGQAFLQLLDQEELREYIDTILVEGHTDSTGSDQWNWLLSSQRAIAVIQYLYEAVPRLAQEYPGYFAAVGHSKYRPAVKASTIAEANRNEKLRRLNRRIEFRIDLSDEKLLGKVIDNLTYHQDKHRIRK